VSQRDPALDRYIDTLLESLRSDYAGVFGNLTCSKLNILQLFESKPSKEALRLLDEWISVPIFKGTCEGDRAMPAIGHSIDNYDMERDS
jgi:hypothetical protein